MKTHIRTNAPAPRPGKRPRRPAEGFSLIEVMVALVVFSLLALGLTAGVMQARKMAETNIVRNTAYTVAQGYLEQVKSLSTDALTQSLASPDTVALETKSISALESGDIEVDDPLFLDGPDTSPSGRTGVNHKQVLIDLQDDESGGERQLLLDMWIDVDIDRISTRSYEIAVEFEYSSPNIRAVRTVQDGGLRMFTSNIVHTQRN